MRRCLASLVWLSAWTILPDASAAPNTAVLMQQATACDQRLHASDKLKRLRSSWQRCIERYADVAASAPQDTTGAFALKRQAELAEELARRSGRRDDARQAQRLRERATRSGEQDNRQPAAPDAQKPVRVVIDPGHGGKDPGTMSAAGLQEKDVVLDVGVRLQKLLERSDHIAPLLTRRTDQFISLEGRTEFARTRDADLFISIHANSSPRRDVKGLEVYVLGESSDADADATASRENDVPGQETVDVGALVQDMLGDLSNSQRDEHSLELAHTLRQAVRQRVGPKYEIVDLGIKRAPFFVLLNSGVPSILSELAFMSNPDDANRLAQPTFRQRIAEALAAGILQYTASPVIAQSN
ncbi:MAG TPA: N-acetylmuramoyl-L-alanine amidase [Nitrospiria bacterium]|nr:N-acetylmuramoyl-L-alanine amidase [Nitrospiria bacterium]